MKYKSIPKELEESFRSSAVVATTREMYNWLYKPVLLVEKMMEIGFSDDEIQKAIDENWTTEGGKLKFENAVEKIIGSRSALEKAGTREGALKAWKTRRRSLLDKLRDAISNRDAKAVVRLKQQLTSGAKLAQQVYGEKDEGI